jgi:hypothetical protein
MSTNNSVPLSESSEESDALNYRRIASHLRTKFPNATPEDIYHAVKTVAEIEQETGAKESDGFLAKS